MKQELKKIIEEAIQSLKLETVNFSIEYPADSTHGDFATNVAMVLAKQTKTNPRELAEKIKSEIEKSKPVFLEKVEIAGPGFINFFISNTFYLDEISNILKKGKKYGLHTDLKGKKVLVEYGNPNPFKEFHIGHVVNAVIGEAIFRLVKSLGADAKRISYHGDVGPQVAKAVWGMMQKVSEYPRKGDSIQQKVAFLGTCYAFGSKAYEERPEIKSEIDEINKKIFEGNDKKIQKLYTEGREWSFSAFDEVFEKIGITKAAKRFLESEIANDGAKIVQDFLSKGIFEKSENAVVFHAEKYDPKLHTRVFINSQGLPTYEAKEIGLTQKKFKTFKPDISIVMTGNEQIEYFKVVLKAIELVNPEWAKKTIHMSHGFLRLSSGKMSSREGGVITGESLVHDVANLVRERIKDRNFSLKEKEEVIEDVTVAAIKYSILKQVSSSDIIFDFEKSISFEGDSGPYLLYTAVRAQSVLEKAEKEGIRAKILKTDVVTPLHKLIAKYPELVLRAGEEKSPHIIATYLVELSSAFNGWYANNQIVVVDAPESASRVALTQATRVVLENGLNLLGMKVPKRM